MDAKALAAEVGRKKVRMHIRTILTGPICSTCQRHTLVAQSVVLVCTVVHRDHVQADRKCVYHMHPLYYCCSN